MSRSYRADVDGLRAIAVLAVLLYHAFPGAVPGGFVGVDVFFVISGFLITGLLIDDMRDHRFSLRDFYARRIRRIYPSLMIVLIACWVVGARVLDPTDFRTEGKHMMWGAGLFSNVLFWRDASYFDGAAETKPLLHLWSLGVEEQFYLVWPVALWATWSRLKLWAVPVLVFASLALCIYQTRSNATLAFFSPATRAWELMLGAALTHPRLRAGLDVTRYGPALGACGIGLLAVSFAWLEPGVPYPGWRALLPTLGTALVIASGPGGPVGWLMSRRGLVTIGLISYPLYLWHWPLLTFARVARDHEISVPARTGLLALSFALAYACYRLVELPLRRGGHRTAKVLALVAVAVVVMTVGGLTFTSDRLTLEASRLADAAEEEQRFATATPSQPCDPDPRLVGKASGVCRKLGDVTRAPLVVIWGDSQADAWSPMLLDLARETGHAAYVFSHPGCPPLLHVRRSDGVGNGRLCAEPGYAEDILRSIESLKPERVFVIARWSLYANGWIKAGRLQNATHFLTTDPTGAATRETSRAALTEQLPRTIDALRAATPSVILFKSLPTLNMLSRRLRAIRNPEIEPTLEEHRALEAFSDAIIDPIASARSIRVFDPAIYTCTERCSMLVNGVLLYTDDNHVTSRGSFELRGQLAPYFK